MFILFEHIVCSFVLIQKNQKIKAVNHLAAGAGGQRKNFKADYF